MSQDACPRERDLGPQPTEGTSPKRGGSGHPLVCSADPGTWLSQKEAGAEARGSPITLTFQKWKEPLPCLR